MDNYFTFYYQSSLLILQKKQDDRIQKYSAEKA
jgi:hypothetical protein